MVSTISSAGVFATSLPKARMSLRTPVEVSLSVAKTAPASGWSASAFSSKAGGTAWPYGTATFTISMPKALHKPFQRSPHRPAIRPMAFEPGGQQFDTAASMPPVPEAVNATTVFFV